LASGFCPRHDTTEAEEFGATWTRRAAALLLLLVFLWVVLSDFLRELADWLW